MDESYNHWGRGPPARGICGWSRGRLIASGSDESLGPRDRPVRHGGSFARFTASLYYRDLRASVTFSRHGGKRSSDTSNAIGRRGRAEYASGCPGNWRSRKFLAGKPESRQTDETRVVGKKKKKVPRLVARNARLEKKDFDV